MWSGSRVITDKDVVIKSVKKEQWDKTRDKVWRLGLQAGLWDSFTQDHLPEYDKDVIFTKDKNLIHFKTTKKLVGLMVYVAQTYTSLVAYLKGIYLILNSWQNCQDTEGWVTQEGRWMK